MDDNLIEVDLTEVGIVPPGQHQATVSKLIYQIKTGPKWNKEGSMEVDKMEWSKHPMDTKRIKLFIRVIGVGDLVHDLYFMESALPMTKRALEGCGVKFTKNGYNPDLALNASILITVVHKDTPDYGLQVSIAKINKA